MIMMTTDDNLTKTMKKMQVLEEGGTRHSHRGDSSSSLPVARIGGGGICWRTTMILVAATRAADARLLQASPGRWFPASEEVAD